MYRQYSIEALYSWSLNITLPIAPRQTSRRHHSVLFTNSASLKAMNSQLAMNPHRLLDLRSLALHQLVAAKLRSDASQLERARAILDRWRGIVSPRALPLLDEWARLFDQGVEKLLEVALEDSERSSQLRQSSPLSCLLAPWERHLFLRHWKSSHETQ